MTSVSDFIVYGASEDAKTMVDGRSSALRWTQRLIGVSLFLAAAGLWLQPGANLEADLIVIKLGLSVFFAVAGFAALSLGRARP